MSKERVLVQIQCFRFVRLTTFTQSCVYQTDKSQVLHELLPKMVINNRKNKYKCLIILGDNTYCALGLIAI